jgi:hypothetical protein
MRSGQKKFALPMDCMPFTAFSRLLSMLLLVIFAALVNPVWHNCI